MTKTWCFGGKHYSSTIKIFEYEKLNVKTKKLVKIIKGICSFCGRNKSQTFTKQMTRAENVIRNAKSKHGHRSARNNSAWCGLNKFVMF